MKEIVPSQLRKAVANFLSESIKIPFASCKMRIDASGLFLLQENGTPNQKITIAVINAVVALPEINATWADSTKIIYHDRLNFGIAIETKKGLAVVTLRDADSKTGAEIAGEIENITVRGRNGMLSPSDFEPKPVIVLNNVGVYPHLIDGHSIPPPSASVMVSTFRAEKVPVVIHESIAIRPMMNVVITFDHRLFDGADIAKFADILKQKLENPL